MHKFKITFRNDANGKTKTCTVKARGICPAIEAAVIKMMLFGWDIIGAELIN